MRIKNYESSFKKNKENLYSLFLRLNSRAFTLVELLVVIAIMAIMSVFALANYGSFGEDQNLKNAALNIQSQIRKAQTNATSNVICGSTFSNTWQVVATATMVYLACPSLGLIKGVPFGDNISVFAVPGIGPDCPANNNQFVISFAPLSGHISFVSPPATNCTSLTIILRNNKISPDCTGANLAKCKQLTIEQGGRIYGQ